MNFLISNVKKLQNTRGWLCGHFMPENSILKTNQMEVKYDQLEPGDTVDEHFHPQGEELFIIVKGKIKTKIDGKNQILERGDFVFIKSRTNEAILEVLEPTAIVAVRTPSIPNNKIYVK